MLLRFCPSCGSRLPQGSEIRFCINCGKNLAELNVPGTVSPDNIAAPVTTSAAANPPVKTPADVMRHYDQFIGELRKQGLDEADFRRRAAELFARLKEQLPPRSAATNRQDSAGKIQLDEKAEECYSVVLKSCNNKEQLVSRLSEVLRRGVTATRMAVDMVPCVIIYKSKASDIQAVLAIFKDENLHYTVVKGNFETNPPLEKLVPGFAALDSELKLLLHKAPANLWVGEQIRTVVPDVDLEGKAGALVVSDQGLYILYESANGKQTQAFVIPYSQLEDVILHEDQAEILELVYKEYGKEEFLRFNNKERLWQVNNFVQQALRH